MRETLPAGADGVHLMVKVEPGVRVRSLPVAGEEKTSKPAVWAVAPEIVARAKRQDLMKERRMVMRNNERE